MFLLLFLSQLSFCSADFVLGGHKIEGSSFFKAPGGQPEDTFIPVSALPTTAVPGVPPVPTAAQSFGSHPSSSNPFQPQPWFPNSNQQTNQQLPLAPVSNQFSGQQNSNSNQQQLFYGQFQPYSPFFNQNSVNPFNSNTNQQPTFNQFQPYSPFGNSNLPSFNQSPNQPLSPDQNQPPPTGTIPNSNSNQPQLPTLHQDSDFAISSGFWPDPNFVFNLRKNGGGSGVDTSQPGGGGTVGGGTVGGGFPDEQAIFIHRAETGDYKYTSNNGGGPPQEYINGISGQGGQNPNPQPTVSPFFPPTTPFVVIPRAEPLAPGTAEALTESIRKSGMLGMLGFPEVLREDVPRSPMRSVSPETSAWSHWELLPVPRQEQSAQYRSWSA